MKKTKRFEMAVFFIRIFFLKNIFLNGNHVRKKLVEIKKNVTQTLDL